MFEIDTIEMISRGPNLSPMTSEDWGPLYPIQGNPQGTFAVNNCNC
jgi:hypothetical protein